MKDDWNLRYQIKRMKWIIAKGYEVTPEGKMVHREVYKKHYGKIPIGWVVHHINHVKKDNSPENLIAMPEELHNRIHAEMKKNGKIYDRIEILSRLDRSIKKEKKKVKQKQSISKAAIKKLNKYHKESLDKKGKDFKLIAKTLSLCKYIKSTKNKSSPPLPIIVPDNPSPNLPCREDIESSWWNK